MKTYIASSSPKIGALKLEALNSTTWKSPSNCFALVTIYVQGDDPMVTIKLNSSTLTQVGAYNYLSTIDTNYIPFMCYLKVNDVLSLTVANASHGNNDLRILRVAYWNF